MALTWLAEVTFGNVSTNPSVTPPALASTDRKMSTVLTPRRRLACSRLLHRSPVKGGAVPALTAAARQAAAWSASQSSAASPRSP